MTKVGQWLVFNRFIDLPLVTSSILLVLITFTKDEVFNAPTLDRKTIILYDKTTVQIGKLKDLVKSTDVETVQIGS